MVVLYLPMKNPLTITVTKGPAIRCRCKDPICSSDPQVPISGVAVASVEPRRAGGLVIHRSG